MAYKEFDKTYRWPIERQHQVNNPYIWRHDLDHLRRQFWEAAQSTSLTVDYYACISDKDDWNNDPNVRWAEPILLPVIFDDSPRVKILKNFGFYSEDDERPTLLYLPMYIDWMTKDLLDVRENSLIRVHYFGQNIPAEFRITDKRMDSVYGIFWVCKLAPERFNQFYLVQEHGRHFLKLGRRDSDVRCEHEYMDEGKDKDTRTFEHDDYTENMRTPGFSADDYFDKIMDSETENTVDFYTKNAKQHNEDIISSQSGEVIWDGPRAKR